MAVVVDGRCGGATANNGVDVAGRGPAGSSACGHNTTPLKSAAAGQIGPGNLFFRWQLIVVVVERVMTSMDSRAMREVLSELIPATTLVGGDCRH